MLNFDYASSARHIESPSDITLSGTPLTKTPSEEPSHISWRDLKNNQEIADLQRFQRKNAEYWAYFTNICPNFPEITSSEEAKKLLEIFKKDPYISQFMPLLSKISYPKALSIVYENIKNNFMTDEAIEICAYYLLSKSYHPETLVHEASLLRGPDHRSYSDEVNRDLFNFEYRNAKESQELRGFVQRLLEIIPLEEIAEIRLATDMMRIVKHLNSSFETKDQCVLSPIHGYNSYKSCISALRNWLESHKELLSSITTIDLSQTGIQRLPRDLLPYLSGLQNVYMNSSLIEDPTVLIDLLQLPNLEHLDFSSNSFADEEKLDRIAALPLRKALENAKHLKTLDLSNSCFFYNECPNLISTCWNQSIDLILDVLSENEQDLTSICKEINTHLPEEAQIPIPTSSLLQPEEVFFNQIYQELEVRREVLDQIQELDLSNCNITFFPSELLPLLRSVRSVYFKENYYEGADLFPAIATLLQLESLESIDLSDNNINAELLQRLTDHIQASTTLKKIYIPNNPILLEDIPELVSVCKVKGIDILYTLPREQRDLIAYCNDFNLITPALKYSTQSYEKLLSYLPRMFGGELKNLDISASARAQIPEEVLPYYSEIKTIKYCRKQEFSENTVSMIKSILQLPKIESVNFSANNLTDENIADLIEHFKRVPSLRIIDLSDNPWDPALHREFIQYCHEHNIVLLRPYSEREVDVITTLQKIQEHITIPPTENGKIFLLTPLLFKDDQHIIEQLSVILEKYKKALAGITHLDFSDLKIHRFPSIIIPYLSHVTSVCLKNTTPAPIPSFNRPEGVKNHQLLANIVNLPNLEEIDFSGNELSSASLACLKSLIQKTDSKLKKIDLSNCSYRQDFLDDLYRLCEIYNIQIIRTKSKKEIDLVKIIKLINKNLPLERRILIPADFSSYEHCLQQMIPFLKLQKDHLKQLKHLNMSNTSIEIFPEELFDYLSGVEQVSLRNFYKKAPQNFHVLTVLCSLPNLKHLDLSWNVLGIPDSTASLNSCLAKARKLTDINLSHTDATSENTELLTDYCSHRGIAYKL